MERMNKIDYYMNIAFAVSLRSTCIRRKVGSIIVKDNRILSTGYNGSPHGMENCINDPSMCYRSKHNIPSGKDLHLCRANHSEVNAIMSALKTGEDLTGAAIYVTTSPCSNCAKMIIQSGITEVYYIDGYEDMFSISLFKEAGINLTKVNGSKFRAPEGESYTTTNDLDAIDPLVAAIYKYKPGTAEFVENRHKIFEEKGLYEYYDEIIYYTDYRPENEVTKIDKEILKKIGTQFANRNELEYNGDFVRQLVVGALVYDVYTDSFIVLKCKGERLKDKLTLVQGHVSKLEKGNVKHRLQTILNKNIKKELTEELTINLEDIMSIEPLYLVQSNDNKISSEHLGVIYLVKIDTGNIEYEIESGEPEKHDVEMLSLFKLSDLKVIDKMDTWLRKVIVQLKDDKRI